MNFDEVFADLEAQFESLENCAQPSVTNSLTQDCRALEITTLQNARMRVLAPIIGTNFVAGLDERLPNWVILPAEGIREIEFQIHQDSDLPLLRFRDVTLGQFVAQLPSNTDVLLTIAGQTRSHVLRASSETFLFVQVAAGLRAIPVAAIEQLKVVDNSGGLLDRVANY